MRVRFCLEDGDDFGHCIAMGGVTLPAFLDHLPHAIGELRVVRPTRPTSLQHRINPCDFALVMERNSFGKDLAPFFL